MRDTPQLVFDHITLYKAGIIERLLAESFAGMAADEAEREKRRRKWHQAGPPGVLSRRHHVAWRWFCRYN